MKPGPTRILLVEDSPGDARLLRTMLGAARLEFDLTHVDRLSAALAGVVSIIRWGRRHDGRLARDNKRRLASA